MFFIVNPQTRRVRYLHGHLHGNLHGPSRTFTDSVFSHAPNLPLFPKLTPTYPKEEMTPDGCIWQAPSPLHIHTFSTYIAPPLPFSLSPSPIPRCLSHPMFLTFKWTANGHLDGLRHFTSKVLHGTFTGSSRARAKFFGEGLPPTSPHTQWAQVKHHSCWS